jgi:RNA polymerase sigma-70 factor (ECF subfamily)
VVTAARRRIAGADRVARFLLGVTRKFGSGSTWRIGRLNGEPALLNFRDDVLRSATAVEMDRGRIRAIHSIMNPAKLERALHPTIDIA